MYRRKWPVILSYFLCTVTRTRAENVVAFCGSDFSSADYIFLQYKMCMMNSNNTQFNLLYIATKTSKSDPQNGTKLSALENGNVT